MTSTSNKCSAAFYQFHVSSVLTIFAASLCNLVSPPRAPAQLIPPTDPINGVSQLEHSLRWWETMVNIPADTNPLLDETGEQAVRGQVGSILYLPGSFGPMSNRTMTVQPGTTIFLPLFNFLGDATGDPATDLEELLEQNGFPPAVIDDLFLEIDGQPIATMSELLTHRQTSDADDPLMLTVFSPENLYVSFDLDPTLGMGDPLDPGSYPAIVPAVVDGYWVGLEPFEPGSTHILHFGGTTMGRPAGDFSQDNTFTIITVPEPTSTASAALCVLALVGLRRRLAS